MSTCLSQAQDKPRLMSSESPVVEDDESSEGEMTDGMYPEQTKTVIQLKFPICFLLYKLAGKRGIYFDILSARISTSILKPRSAFVFN